MAASERVKFRGGGRGMALAVAVIGWWFAAPDACAFVHEPRALPDFDTRVIVPSARTLPTFVPVRIDAERAVVDPRRKTLHLLSAGGRRLSGPSFESPERVARAFIAARAEALGLGPAELRDLRVESLVYDRANGRSHVWFLEHAGAIPVFNGRIGVHLDARGQVILLGAGDLGTVTGVDLAAQLSVSEAAAAALDPVVSGAKAALAGGPWQKEAPLVIFLTADGPRLAYEMRVAGEAEAIYDILIDAHDGSLLWRLNLTRYARGLAWNLNPVIAPARTLKSFDATAESPAGWVTANVTTGNNVVAQWDPGLNVFNLFCLNGTLTDPAPPPAFQDFQYPIDLAQSPQTYTDASVTNLFYLNNFIHDYLYDLGFDEVAGNFQNSNFGKGGAGSDSVSAQGQDGWPACAKTTLPNTNNANFSTPADGSPGTMQMYVWTLTTPERDGSLDSDVVIHEFCHGLSNRLVGGPACSTCLSGAQSGAMGEGWGDWFACSIAADDAVGEYSSGWVDGIRRYRYGSSPLGFGDLGNSGCEVHDDGEIWATVLWQLRGDYLALYGPAGRRMIEQDVVDALKLSPPNPTFLDMRDAMVAAALQNGEERCAVWQIYANRGMGSDATTSGDTCNAVAGSAVPAGCECLDPGQVQGFTLVDAPSGGFQLDWASLAASGAAGYTVLRATSGCLGPFTVLAQVQEPAHGFNDSSVSPGTTYAYEIRAFTAFGTLCPGAVSACLERTATCTAGGPAITANSLLGRKEIAAAHFAWTPVGSGRYNLHQTLTPAAIPLLYQDGASRVAQVGVPDVLHTPTLAPGEVAYYQVYGADGCTGDSLP